MSRKLREIRHEKYKAKLEKIRKYITYFFNSNQLPHYLNLPF